MKKRILSMMGVLVMLLLMAPVGRALEEPDAEKKGSISILMAHQGQAVPGGSMTLYRVAEVIEENGADYSFRLTEAFAGSLLSLEDLMDSALAPALAAYIQEKEISGVKKTIGSDGTLVFEDLELGLYLLVQEEPAKGFLAVNPFLVSVPGRKDGSYVYDVDGTPKLALVEDPTPPTEPTEPAPPPELPQTGLNQWPILVLAAGGLLMIVLGAAIWVSGRNKEYEA